MSHFNEAFDTAYFDAQSGRALFHKGEIVIESARAT